MGFTSVLLALALQQGFTTPPGGDTTGYWQQRVAYTISARLDEAAQRITAAGTMRYVNNSPDTLRELYVHQYLNAFRPASRWSAADEREGRIRFQRLRDPDHGYERFTAPVTVNGVAATVTYPGAPDSTVARIALPAPLAPRDSVTVAFAWEARPSTLPRRQGRRGRHWDLAHWYPRIAVYDRGGWQAKALEPAGEFYGEFGDYDVTLTVARDQVLAATGVPVSGDPGWEGARRHGIVYAAAAAYGAHSPEPLSAAAELKQVRFVAREVHHFAWSASPEYRYEGGVYVRTPPRGRVRAWDSVAIHVLYQPGDDTTWGGGRVVQRTANSLAWLERIFGRYAYPQMTVLHRIEGGGTEFPMMQMNGSPSQGLNLHEGGHVWLHGILANNEWRSGWLDEGFTSYQTEWAQTLTPQERRRAGIEDRFGTVGGYRGRAILPAMSRFDAIGLQMTMMDLDGEAQPIGLAAHEFRDFGTYNQMIYTRAQVMYGQLRDALGDSAWSAALHDYYERWALKHVDERALRGSAERASGRDLGWFFEQWVHETGVMDYGLADVRQERAGSSWVTVATVERRGEYEHPIMVGVRTAAGWTTERIANPAARVQDVRIVTFTQPLEVRLDPYHFSWDWNRVNDVPRRQRRARVAFDWPFLQQSDRNRIVDVIRPLAWYSEPGGLTLGARSRSAYLDVIDRRELGVGFPLKKRGEVGYPQVWGRIENPYLLPFSRPLIGWGASFALLDGVFLADGSHRKDLRGWASGWVEGRITYARVLDTTFMPEQWDRSAIDYTLTLRPRWQQGARRLFVDYRGTGGVRERGYGKSEVALGLVRTVGKNQLRARVYGALAGGDLPPQRSLLIGAQDGVTTFRHHWWRPRQGILKQRDVHGLPLGGGGFRGYGWAAATDGLVAGNSDVSREIKASRGEVALSWRAHLFGNVGAARRVGGGVLAEAGPGISVSGRVFDRPIGLRFDFPVFVHQVATPVGIPGREVAWRYVLSFTDIWPD